MKKVLYSIFFALFGTISLHADTQEEFLASYRTALEQKDAAKLLSLYYTEGCSEADSNSLKQLIPIMHFYKGKLKDVKFTPPSNDAVQIQIADGKKYELTHPIEGQIKFYYESQQQNGTSHYEGGDVYAVINGIHRLVAMKSSDLGWKGPKDQHIGFGVTGTGQENVMVKYQWNASGVDQEQTAPNPGGAVLLGQFIRSVTATSTNDDTDVTLSVREGGKEIYSSPPLKGRGTIEYKRGQ